MKEIAIARRLIGGAQQPLIVAELSGNHHGDLGRALRIVEAAAAAGAHAVKLQTYTADTMTIDLDAREFRVEDHPLWSGMSLHQLYLRAATPWEWHQRIFERCGELGLLWFSTPFDASAVDFLETLGVPCHKIASFELTDTPLLRKVAATGKPVLLSTGMATLDELDEAVQALRGGGCRDLVLLKCTSAYPAPPAEINLRTMVDMAARYEAPVGLSDHTLGTAVAVAAVALGAAVIEKHLTLDRAGGGLDAAFSLEPQELRALVRDTQLAWQSLGGVSYGPTEQERASLRFRRSLYVVADLRAGEAFSERNVRAIRPGLGLPPGRLAEVLGRRAARDIGRGTPLSWDLVAGE